jgi:TPR repeat protein
MGFGTTKDEDEAVKWYLLAAHRGCPRAAHNLGVCFHNGIGVRADDVEAVYWLTRAADMNHPVQGRRSRLDLRLTEVHRMQCHC